jgi:molybdopterin synthase catalytic subunit
MEMVQDTTGAACIFTGVVRGLTQHGEFHQTTSLIYEAYTPMAEEKMEQVAEEIRLHWPAVEGIGIIQRIGHLEAGTPTVAIACTSSHRDGGIFEAAHYGIDRLKEIVPVWKKEIGPQGDSWIEGGYQPKRGD